MLDESFVSILLLILFLSLKIINKFIELKQASIFKSPGTYTSCDVGTESYRGMLKSMLKSSVVKWQNSRPELCSHLICMWVQFLAVDDLPMLPYSDINIAKVHTALTTFHQWKQRSLSTKFVQHKPLQQQILQINFNNFMKTTNLDSYKCTSGTQRFNQWKFYF